MIIIDTSVWVDYLNGVRTRQTDWLDAALETERLGLTDLILCEVLLGLRSEREALLTYRRLTEFAIFPMGGTALAVNAARHYRSLRARGKTVRRTIDCLIATFCLMEEHVLLHNDRDFDAFEQLLGLRVLHPL